MLRSFVTKDGSNQRLNEASRDVVNGLQITLDAFTTRAEQDHGLQILQFKLDILWTMLDAMWMAYIEKKPPYWNSPAK